ncbi:hypothetical protein Q8F55_003067 [Vanrija albida]|uniref:Ubiquinone biosynthesis protein n=1 Tax=Vanrija albida TaxID=181172 RepID=A0ABR3QBP5_9TREE
MSLRSAVLAHALPHLPRTSFTRAALSTALASLPPSDAQHRPPLSHDVVDTLFGPGAAGPRALVRAWEDAGLEGMRGAKGSVKDVLGARLAYSASVGEHLVEAHALLATPTTTPSIPVPTDVLARLRPLARFSTPPLYRPFAAGAARAAEGPVSRVLEATGGRLPLVAVDPLAPLAYAWRVADAAVRAANPHAGAKGPVGEPAGAGVEWYTSRAALALAYLTAEAQLLQLYPAPLEGTPAPLVDSAATNPHFAAAKDQLARALRRYDDAKTILAAGENSADSLISFVELATRSVAGIIRSRGF